MSPAATNRPTDRRVVLDVDTGIDDALALLYAAASPTLDLCGVTTVAGNVPVAVAARNSAAVLAHCGADGVPVAAGAGRTSTGGGPRTGETNHGPDGLGGVEVPPGPGPSELTVGQLMDSAAAGGPVTLVALAPLTNVAALAATAEDVVVLGGELAHHDIPEFNATHDPAATAQVLASDRPLTLYAVEVFERVAVHPDGLDRLRSSGRPGARLAAELLAVRRGGLIGDAGALVLLSHPDLFRVERRRIGMPDDRLTQTTEGRWTDVVVDVDAAAVAAAFVDVLLTAGVLP